MNAIVFFSFLFYISVFFFFLFFEGQWLVLWPHCPVHNCLLTAVVLYLLIAANKD